MHSKNDNNKVMTYDYANEVMKEIFELLLSRYWIELKTSVKGSDFTFDSANLLYCKYHQISFILGGSYLESPDWIK